MAMYRPHKLGWLDELIREGRNRGAAPDGSNVAPATMAGVRMLLRHLRKGGCTVILPDQVPGEGEGEWVDFFGRPAYTMTLTGRLQEASGRGDRVLLRRAPAGRRRVPAAPARPRGALAGRPRGGGARRERGRRGAHPPGARAVPVGLQPLQAAGGRAARAGSDRDE